MRLRLGLKDKRGMGIVLVIFILLAFSCLGYVGLSLLASQTQDYLNHLYSTQAFYLAEAARQFNLEFYLAYATQFDSSSPIYYALPYPVTKNVCPVSGCTDTGFTIESSGCSSKTCGVSYTGFVNGTTGIRRKVKENYDGNHCYHPQDSCSSLANYSVPMRLNNFIGYFGQRSTVSDFDVRLRGGGVNLTTLDSRRNLYISLNNTNPSDEFALMLGTIGSASNPVDVVVNRGPSVIDVTGTIRGDLYCSGTITNNGTVDDGIADGSDTHPGWTNFPSELPDLGVQYYNAEMGIAAGVLLTEAAIGRYKGDQNSGTLGWSDLGAMNRYINGNLTIGQNANITVGPANIVVNGNITVTSGSVSPYTRIDERINLIASGWIDIGDYVRIGGIYNAGPPESITGAGSYIRANGRLTAPAEKVNYSITVGNNSRIKGFLFCPFTSLNWVININQGATVWGILYGSRIGENVSSSDPNDDIDFGTVNGGIYSYDCPYWGTWTPAPGGERLRTITIRHSQNYTPLMAKDLYYIYPTWTEDRK